MHAAVAAANIARAMCGERLDLPAWPFAVSDVAAAVDQLGEGAVGR